MNSSPRAKAHKLKPNGNNANGGGSPITNGPKKKAKKQQVEMEIGEDVFEEDDVRSYNGYQSQYMSPNPAMSMNGVGVFRSVDSLVRLNAPLAIAINSNFVCFTG
ncbi:hypothetical protein EON63_11890 [archaeon]|nr:MAG: hypothetical protein EON63_11890 [archaeon]